MMLFRFHYISHLYSVFWQIKLVGQLAPLRPGDVVFPQEFLLQPTDLLPAEGGPVPAHATLLLNGRSICDLLTRK